MSWPLMGETITFSDRLKMAFFAMTTKKFTNGEKVKKFETYYCPVLFQNLKGFRINKSVQGLQGNQQYSGSGTTKWQIWRVCSNFSCPSPDPTLNFEGASRRKPGPGLIKQNIKKQFMAHTKQ